MYAFDKAIDSVNKVAKDTRLEDVFLVAREAFDDSYFDAGLNPIDAIGEAVLFAQKQTSHVVSNSGKIPEKYMNDKVSILSRMFRIQQNIHQVLMGLV